MGHGSQRQRFAPATSAGWSFLLGSSWGPGCLFSNTECMQIDNRHTLLNVIKKTTLVYKHEFALVQCQDFQSFVICDFGGDFLFLEKGLRHISSVLAVLLVFKWIKYKQGCSNVYWANSIQLGVLEGHKDLASALWGFPFMPEWPASKFLSQDKSAMNAKCPRPCSFSTLQHSRALPLW